MMAHKKKRVERSQKKYVDKYMTHIDCPLEKGIGHRTVYETNDVVDDFLSSICLGHLLLQKPLSNLVHEHKKVLAR